MNRVTNFATPLTRKIVRMSKNAAISAPRSGPVICPARIDMPRIATTRPRTCGSVTSAMRMFALVFHMAMPTPPMNSSTKNSM